MATPIDDMTTQKIFKAIEEQCDTLKKIGGRLTKLEESKHKKPIHVNIHDEDEGEDYDEGRHKTSLAELSIVQIIHKPLDIGNVVPPKRVLSIVMESGASTNCEGLIGTYSVSAPTS